MTWQGPGTADLREQGDMTQSTDAPTTSDPTRDRIDVDEINRTIRDALADTPPRRYEELTELEELLRGHIQLLLPAAEAAVAELWRGSVQWYDGSTRLSNIRRHLEQGLGDGLRSAQRHVAHLAHSCTWLLEQTQPKKRLCPRCSQVRQDTRMVAAVESGSGAGAVIYACRDCEPNGPWDEENAHTGA